jgi:hypothetical protein
MAMSSYCKWNGNVTVASLRQGEEEKLDSNLLTMCFITARSTSWSALTSGFRRFGVLALVSVGLCPFVSGEC